MDPATQAITEIWQTAETIDQIWARVGWLNFLISMTNVLLFALIVSNNLNRKSGDK